jgi:predicted Zn-dependent protease
MEALHKFKLFGQEWSIRMGTELELDTDLGRCVVDQNLILLNDTQTEASLRHTLTHELIHAVEQKLHLGLKEKQVDLLALGLLDLLSSNQELKNLFGEKHDG